MKNLKKVLKALVKTKLKKTDKKPAAKAPKKPDKVKAKSSAPKKATAPTSKLAKKPTAVAPKKVLPSKVAAAPKKALAKSLAPAAPKQATKKVEVKVTAKKVAEKPAAAVETSKKLKKSVEVSAEKPAKAAKKAAPEPVEEVVEPKREYNDEEIILTDADGRRYCRVKECDQIASVDAYCRYHYLLFWKKIQVRKKILTEGKLERYVEELTARYPDKYLEMLRKDLRSEKDFTNAIQELELDDHSGENDLEDEAQSYIEEVRGMSSEGGGSSRDDDEF